MSFLVPAILKNYNVKKETLSIIVGYLGLFYKHILNYIKIHIKDFNLKILIIKDIKDFNLKYKIFENLKNLNEALLTLVLLAAWIFQKILLRREFNRQLGINCCHLDEESDKFRQEIDEDMSAVKITKHCFGTCHFQ